MERQGKYVYCVIKGAEKRSFGKGFNGNTVYTIPYRDVSAVVSDTPPVEYNPNETNALIHEEVVERVMQEHTVLPLGFGNVFINETRVKWLLAKFYQTFKMYLERLEGKVELGIKVFYDLEVAKRELEASYEVERRKEYLTSKTGRVKWLLAKFYRTFKMILSFDRSKEDVISRMAGENYYKKISEKAYEYGVKVYEALKEHAEATSLMKRIGGNMILNGAFLVEKQKIQDFKMELEKLEKGYAGRGLEFQFSGPWPPYNFVRIDIGR